MWLLEPSGYSIRMFEYYRLAWSRSTLRYEDQ